MDLFHCSTWNSMHILLLIQWFSVTSVCSPNSISPRRSKSNLTSGVLKCPNVKGSSDCKMSCMRDEHCDNYGDLLRCCPVGPGHVCKAECKEPVLSQGGGSGICYDFKLDRQYVSGDLFVRDGVCCRCERDGRANCTAIGSCNQGCYYGSTYYNDGVAISRSSCRNCTCENGTVFCKWNTNCTQEKCKYKGKVYTLEHIIRLDNGCKECVCQYRGWSCTAITCNAARSSSTSVGISRVKACVFAILIVNMQYLLQS
ncbi:SCO-spondin-like [Actinia tenebrosa]|uniref:SCO-spondin-like n=1 Tax=Actinia tenebrosa TaxID=6105 RepID=A0A6P8J214_ACTTE|nr:SCO-spondin-like [Actinia tenebrosa]